MKPTSPHSSKTRFGASFYRFLALALLVTLAACGGGGGDGNSTTGTGAPLERSTGSNEDPVRAGEPGGFWSGVMDAINDGGSNTATVSSASLEPLSGSGDGQVRAGEPGGVWSGLLNLIGIDSHAEFNAVTTPLDAVRLANQATFGPNETLIAQIRQKGPSFWIAEQMNLQRQEVRVKPGAPDVVMTAVSLPRSRYSSGGTGIVHQQTSEANFCATRGENCWRDWFSSTPLVWDFYRNAVQGPDQLRLRVGLALQQMLVISNYEVNGTYGLRNYNNMLLDHAFGNYRELLRKVILSPVMGDYLDHVNNNKDAPNENFARELLQLFSLGTCLLNPDGTLQNDSCTPTYNNDQVRDYAFALTGWTYPPGGSTPYGCWPTGANCQFYDGDMVARSALHATTKPLALLSNVSLSANAHTAQTALDAVLNSLMAHPNIGPFVARHLIQQLVTSNPSPAYVQRVANAFNTGRHSTFGAGAKGDLMATVAAVLLDTEARTAPPPNSAGRLREPIQLFTGALRALNGRTDGDTLGWWWGEELRQHVFRPPSVFNFYPPDYPVAGTNLVGPSFGIHNANTALNRINFLNYLLFWNGSNPSNNVPNPIGTKADLSAFNADASNAAALVDRLAMLTTGEPLPSASRAAVINAVNAYPSITEENRNNRVRQAAYLVLASPQFQMTR